MTQDVIAAGRNLNTAVRDHSLSLASKDADATTAARRNAEAAMAAYLDTVEAYGREAWRNPETSIAENQENCLAVVGRPSGKETYRC